MLSLTPTNLCPLYTFRAHPTLDWNLGPSKPSFSGGSAVSFQNIYMGPTLLVSLNSRHSVFTSKDVFFYWIINIQVG